MAARARGRRSWRPCGKVPLMGRVAKNGKFVVASWALVALWAGFIFFMSSNTGSGLNEGSGLVSCVYRALKDVQEQLLGPGADVVSSLAHFCEYAVLGALLMNALRCHMPLRRALAVAIACGSLYGASDEFHQLFVEGRLCDPLDWLVDTVGSAFGGCLCLLALRARCRAAASRSASAGRRAIADRGDGEV